MKGRITLLLVATAAGLLAGRTRAEVKGITLGITVNCPYALAG